MFSMSRILRTAVSYRFTTAFLLFALILSVGKTGAAETISVVVGADAGCGSHAGGFDARYQNQRIEVIFFHSGNRANPVENPLKVYKGDKQVEDWRSILCPTPGTSGIPLTGKTVSIEGNWADGKTFQATNIFLSTIK
jgi:hypothetical protein